jgi:hypothetical protein
MIITIIRFTYTSLFKIMISTGEEQRALIAKLLAIIEELRRELEFKKAKLKSYSRKASR